jgi:drug/metabolite transporter (DMT)-like permease
VLAERFFGFHLGRRQWLCVMITAAGLTIVGLTGGGRGEGRSSLAALIAVESAVFALGAGLVAVSTQRSVQPRREGLLLATAAGALFGVSDVAVKYLTHAHGPVLGPISPWTLTAVTSFVISFHASARSLQVGLPTEVIAITSVTATLAGILIFGESIGSGAVGITGRMLAFLLVIAGAAMIRAPVRLKPTRPNLGPKDPSDRDRNPVHSDRARMAASGSRG